MSCFRSECTQLWSLLLLVQMRDDATGLTTSDGTAISYGSAAAAIAKLRDVLGGTSSASVENSITRTATAYTSSVTTANQPNLFAVNSAGVSFVRSPYQVWLTMQALLQFQVLCNNSCWWHTCSGCFYRCWTLCTFPTLPLLAAFSLMGSQVCVCMLHTLRLLWPCLHLVITGHVAAGNSALASKTSTPAKKRCAKSS